MSPLFESSFTGAHPSNNIQKNTIKKKDKTSWTHNNIPEQKFKFQ